MQVHLVQIDSVCILQHRAYYFTLYSGIKVEVCRTFPSLINYRREVQLGTSIFQYIKGQYQEFIGAQSI